MPLSRRQKYSLAGAGALGGLVLLAAVLFRRRVIGAVKSGARVVSGVLTAAQDAFIERVKRLPVSPTLPYAALPPIPFSEVGPFGTDRSFESLTESFRPKAEALHEDLKKLFAPRGVEVRVSETRRSQTRQFYLYSIGRAFQAPGRSSTVTNTLNSNHFSGNAVDFLFVRAGAVVPGGEVDGVIRPHAALLEKKYGVRWGGNFKSFVDLPHWENA